MAGKFKRIVTVCALFYPCILLSWGQKDFRPGFIIGNVNDTIFGEINLGTNSQNATVCEFRSVNGSEIVKYSPADIKGYRINNEKYYVAKTVQIDSTEQTLFLEFLVEGIVNIYYYNGFGKVTYFIEKDGEITALTNDESIVSKDGIKFSVNTHKYKGVLIYIFRDSPDIVRKIEHTSFDMKPLINVTKEYHNSVCDDYQCIDYTKSTKPNMYLEPSIGLNISRLNIKSSDDHTFSVNPGFALQIRFIPLKTFHRINFITGMQFMHQVFDGNLTTGIYDEYAVHTYNIKINIKNMVVPVTFEYALLAGKLQPYLSISYQNVFNFDQEYSVKIVNEPFYDGRSVHPVESMLRKYYAGIVGGAGLRYKTGKGYFFINYQTGYWFNVINARNFLDYTSINPQFMSLGYQIHL